jgi:hypothetical protein
MVLGFDTETLYPRRIFCSAHVLVKQHGEGAPLEAAQRAGAMLEAGDLDGHAVWSRIVGAVEELLRPEPKQGERVQ